MVVDGKPIYVVKDMNMSWCEDESKRYLDIVGIVTDERRANEMRDGAEKVFGREFRVIKYPLMGEF